MCLPSLTTIGPCIKSPFTTSVYLQCVTKCESSVSVESRDMGFYNLILRAQLDVYLYFMFSFWCVTVMLFAFILFFLSRFMLTGISVPALCTSMVILGVRLYTMMPKFL